MRNARMGRPTAVVLLAGVCALLITALAGCGSSDSKASSGTTTTKAAAGPPPEQRCVRLWNDPANDLRQIIGARLSTGTDAYVSVGFASDYPDKCLVTISLPAIGSASQFLEGGMNGMPYAFPQEADPASLDPSLTNWNATLSDDATMKLGRG